MCPPHKHTQIVGLWRVTDAQQGHHWYYPISPTQRETSLPGGSVRFHPEVAALSLLFLPFHLNSSVKGNKTVCNIHESNTSRGMLSRQNRQSAAVEKKLKPASRNLCAHRALPLSGLLGEMQRAALQRCHHYSYLIESDMRRKERQMCASVTAYYSKIGDGIAVDCDPRKYDKPLK